MGIIKNIFNLIIKNSKKFFIDVKKVFDKFVKIIVNIKKIGLVWNYFCLGIVYYIEIKNE